MASDFKARRRALSPSKVAPNLPKVPPGHSLKRPAPPLRGPRGESGTGPPGPPGAAAVVTDPLIIHELQGAEDAGVGESGNLLVTGAGYLALEGPAEIQLKAAVVRLRLNDEDVLPVAVEARLVGGSPALGFFGADPVPRPSITGATTQLQLDSLVAALAALGLVTDGR